MARGDQLARQWKIIQSLISSRIGQSVTDLAEDLDCHSEPCIEILKHCRRPGFRFIRI